VPSHFNWTLQRLPIINLPTDYKGTSEINTTTPVDSTQYLASTRCYWMHQTSPQTCRWLYYLSMPHTFCETISSGHSIWPSVLSVRKRSDHLPETKKTAHINQMLNKHACERVEVRDSGTVPPAACCCTHNCLPQGNQQVTLVPLTAFYLQFLYTAWCRQNSEDSCRRGHNNTLLTYLLHTAESFLRS
jgi:hypothetical protein